jgi:hypothetical protein
VARLDGWVGWATGLDGPDGLDGWAGRVAVRGRDHESSPSRTNLTEIVQEGLAS